MGIFTLFCLLIILTNGIVSPAFNSSSLTNIRQRIQDKNWTVTGDHSKEKFLELMKNGKPANKTSKVNDHSFNYNRSIIHGEEKNIKESESHVDPHKISNRFESTIEKPKVNNIDFPSALSLSEELNRHFKNGETTSENATTNLINRHGYTSIPGIAQLGTFDFKLVKNASTKSFNESGLYNEKWDLVLTTKKPSLHYITSQPKLCSALRNDGTSLSSTKVTHDLVSTSAPSTAMHTTTSKLHSTSFSSKDNNQTFTKKNRRNVPHFFDQKTSSTQNVLCTLCTLTTLPQKRETIKCSEPCEEKCTTKNCEKNNFIKNEPPDSYSQLVNQRKWPHRRSVHADFYPLGKNKKTSRKKCKFKRQKAKYYNIDDLFPTESYLNRFRKKFTLWCCQEGTRSESPNNANNDSKTMPGKEIFPMEKEISPTWTTAISAVKPDAVSIKAMGKSNTEKEGGAPNSEHDIKNEEGKKDNDELKSKDENSESDLSYNITSLINPKTFIKRPNTEVARQKRNLKRMPSLIENKTGTHTKEGNNFNINTSIEHTSNEENNCNQVSSLGYENRIQTIGGSSKFSGVEILPIELIKKLISSPSKAALDNGPSASNEHDRVKPRSILGQLLATSSRPSKVKDRKPWEQPWREGDLDMQLLNLSQTRKPMEPAQNTEVANFKVFNEDQPVCPSCGRKVSSVVNKKILSFNDQLKVQKMNDLGTINEVNEDFAVIKLPSSTSVPTFTKRLRSTPAFPNNNIVTYTLSCSKVVENQDDVGPPFSEYPMTKAVHILERQGFRPSFYLEIPDQLGELIKDAALLKTKSLRKGMNRISLDRYHKDGMRSNDSMLVYVNPYDVENENLFVPLPEFYKLICSEAKHVPERLNKFYGVEDSPVDHSLEHQIRQPLKFRDHGIPLPPNPMPFALVPAYIPIKPPSNDLHQPYRSCFASSPQKTLREDYFNIPRAFENLHSAGTTTSRPSTSVCKLNSNPTVISAAKSLSTLPKEIEASLINSILRMCTPRTADIITNRHNKVPLFIVMQDIPNGEPYLEFKKPPEEPLNSESLSIIPLQNLTKFVPSAIQLQSENIKTP